MKPVLIVMLLIISAAVKAQSDPAAEVAGKIAQKMKDSLSLTETQKGLLYGINLQLHSSKMAARQQYAGTDSVRIYMQRIENTRDSLYRTVLNEEKYQLYLEKKKVLVSNN